MKSRFQSQDSTMLAWEVSNLVFHGEFRIFHSFNYCLYFCSIWYIYLERVGR